MAATSSSQQVQTRSGAALLHVAQPTGGQHTNNLQTSATTINTDTAPSPLDSGGSSTEHSASGGSHSSFLSDQSKASSTTSKPPMPTQANAGAETISFHLKTSIFTRRVTINSDKMALGLIKQLAVAFLNELYFQHQYPAGTPIGDYIRKHFKSSDNLCQLYEKLLLRKYDREHETFLPFNSVSDIEPESFISVEVSEKPTSANLLTNAPLGSVVGGASSDTPATNLRLSHEFKPKSYFFITLCCSCDQVIKGVFRQGYQCASCGQNFCPKCKTRAEQAGETCLAPSTSTTAPMPTTTPSSMKDSASGLSLATQTSTVATTTGHQSSAAQSGGTQKLDALQFMAKRKSASNLLHFNPFESLHFNQQQQQHLMEKQEKPKSGSTAGVLEPVLLQLSKNLLKENKATQEQNTIQQQQPQTSSLSVSQQAHLSSSDQNLSGQVKEMTAAAAAGPIREVADDMETSSSSATQQSGQLSTSARASTLYLTPRASMRSRDQNHAFVSVASWDQVPEKAACGVCNKPLEPQRTSTLSPLPAPSMCTRCKLQLHVHCQGLVLADCLSRITESSRAAALETSAAPNSSGGTQTTSAAAAAAALPGGGAVASLEAGQKKSGLNSSPSNASKENIRLHRLAPSVKHLKRPDTTKPVIEGWLKHTTLSDERARQHYWRLDDTDITLYENETSTRYFRAIALNKITRVMSASSLPKRVREEILLAGSSGSDETAAPATATGGPASSETVLPSNQSGANSKSANSSPKRSAQFDEQMNAMFAFELATGSMFLVQAASKLEASRWRDMLANVMKKIGAEVEAKSAASAVDQQQQQQKPETATGQEASQPMQENHAGPQKQPPTRNHRAHHQYNGGPVNPRKVYTDSNRSRLYNRPRKTIQVDPMAVPDHYIKGKYLIEQDRVKGYGFVELGSGQFGKVYAAISELKAEDTSKGLWSGVPVAIKEISKARFDLRQQAKLKNEANILAQLDHPGVIILERVHDLEDKIYIVMEQLEDDMLEMIVSTEEKRLNERVTKFLTYQILEALKYLHAKNIAHCDLKPENVLLVERRSQFPQIKLCDFGFAKIIEDNSFRSSLVGTPAYLAPEVVKGEKYNRSVDLWSVGVIVYVSLSGEFPFNEGENIHDQISRANFMYPEQPWAKISSQAKKFIDSLLRVNCEHRLSASRAQMDNWIQDFQLWCDLSDLEVRVGKRWVTDDADFERWTRYARKQNLQIPRSAIQLHDELLAD